MFPFLDQIPQTKPELLIIVTSLTLSFLLSFIISWFYKRISSGFSYDRSFGFTLILITVIVCSIMITIGSNIALSLGLIGSLSIIRFRTAIKSSTDMAFIFWCISVGLASGAQIYHAAVANVIIVGIIIFIVNRSKIFFNVNTDYILVVELNQDIDVKKVSSLLTDNFLNWNIKSSFSNKDRTEITYSIFSKKNLNTEDLLNKINNLKSVKSVSLLSPETNLYI